MAWLHCNGLWRERESKTPPINYKTHETMKTRGYSYSHVLTVMILKRPLQCNKYNNYISISLSLSVFETLSITFAGLVAEKQRYRVL